VNPAAEGVSRIRRSVLPSLLATLADNRRRRDEVRLFEIGKGYSPSAGGEPAELHACALVWAAAPAGEGARFDRDPLVRLKGAVADLLVGCGWSAPAWERASETPAWAHPARCLVARLEGAAEPVATLAGLEPLVARRLELTGDLACDVACAELSIDALLAAPRVQNATRPIPKFPAVKVDVAAALPLDVEAARLVAAIEKAGKGTVAASDLFDVYTGPNLGTGRKSLAFHVTLESDDRTLSEQDVARFLDRLAREVAELGGELRRA
jgi:phenylalanyl-tRNA synthetase beta chain